MSTERTSPTAATMIRAGAAVPAGAVPALWPPLPAWLRADRVLFYVVAIAGMVLLMPRFLVIGQWAVGRFVLGMAVARPNLEAWPYIPSILLPLCVLAVVTFAASYRARVATLIVAGVALSFPYGYVNGPSILAFLVFAAIAFGIIRLPIGRGYAATLMLGLSLLALAIGPHLPHAAPFSGIVAHQVMLLPLLWYSVYEQATPRGPLRFPRFLIYLSGRFIGSPSVTYPDLFSAAPTGERLIQTRLAGVKTLYIAIVAAIATAGAEWVERVYPSVTLTGLPLLASSYVAYVGTYCKIVVTFNLFIGVLRLFGVPVRSNFNYWLLAPTPNEHWKRWNMLFREWIVTFVFFPIMRARRWLFAAVMASLLVSGVLHLVAVLAYTGMSASALTAHTVYWLVNGLAIYAFLIVPQRWPGFVARMKFRESRGWLVVGIVSTSAFYAFMFGIRENCQSWASIQSYLERLVSM